MSVTTNDAGPSGYRIRDLTVDLVRREIRRQGRILPCGRLTFELLALLAQRAPAVVSRSLLVERLWSGRYVSPATIKRRISLLRETLGDRAEDPVYLRVVRGHGYALLPSVEPLGPLAIRYALGIRFAAAAAVLAAAFLLGAEVGYQDGLRPAIPGRQGAETVVVTAWPYELSNDEYEVVVSAANGFIDAVRRTDFIDRIGLPSNSEQRTARDSLTVLARATTNDVEAIYVTLGLLRDDRPDVRLSRDSELAFWSRELQDFQRPLSGDIDPPAYRTHVLPVARDYGSNLTLIANYRFDRDEMRTLPREIPMEVADSVATAIYRQTPQPAGAGDR